MMQFFRATVFLAVFAVTPALGQTALQADYGGASIAAIVNGQVITNQDVTGRASLLALSTGMPASPDILGRLRPQVTTQLIDQTLQLQEINKRGVVVPESDIAGAIAHIEQNNNLPAGALRTKLTSEGVPYGTLVAQLRTELGWQAVLHQVLGTELQPTAGDMNAEKKALQAEMGKTQYHLAEIFIPVSDPADDATAKNFASTVIAQLRTGAPFPIIAAQFSQAPSALQGGDLGFVSPSQLDPSVAAVVATMPAGAISNPIRVPGGYDIVQLQQSQVVGAASLEQLTIRQAFARYPTPITNGSVGPAQGAVIDKLVQAAHGAKSCDDVAAINASFGTVRPADPGPVNLADVNPPEFQALLANLPIGQVSQPLVAPDGASIVMVCTRQKVAQALPSDDDITQMIINRRVEMESKQLLDSLRHQSIISGQSSVVSGQ
jgi:peptidyl-prolyl cis-trans isomerase SurA